MRISNKKSFCFLFNYNRYFQILKSFDLTAGFYFSDTYDLTNTFQTNVVSMVNLENNSFDTKKSYKFGKCPSISTYNDFFLWNHCNILEFNHLLKNKRWIVPFIYGYIEQISIFFFFIILMS